MIRERFSEKFFSFFYQLPPIDKSENLNVIKIAFKEATGLELFSKHKRHEEAEKILVKLVHLPRPLHKFWQSISRRSEQFKRDVDHWDLCLLSAIEQLDISAYHYILSHFERMASLKNMSEIELVKTELKDIGVKEVSILAIEFLFFWKEDVNPDDPFEKYSRACCNANIRSAVLGDTVFIEVYSLLRKHSILNVDVQAFSCSLVEVIGTLNVTSAQSEILLDLLEFVKVNRKINLFKVTESIILALDRFPHVALETMPALVTLVADSHGDRIDTSQLMELISHPNTPYHLLAKMYFKFAEKNQTITGSEQQKFAQLLINHFDKNYLSHPDVFFDTDDGLSYLYRVRHAYAVLGEDNQVVPYLERALFQFRYLEQFIGLLISTRTPPSATLTTQQIEVIDALVSHEVFMKGVAAVGIPSEIQNTLNDYMARVSIADGKVEVKPGQED